LAPALAPGLSLQDKAIRQQAIDVVLSRNSNLALVVAGASRRDHSRANDLPQGARVYALGRRSGFTVRWGDRCT
jgi:hypothetical protein